MNRSVVEVNNKEFLYMLTTYNFDVDSFGIKNLIWIESGIRKKTSKLAQNNNAQSIKYFKSSSNLDWLELSGVL